MSGPVQDGLEALWGRYRSKWRRLFSTKAIAELEMRASFDVDLLTSWRIGNKVPKGTVPDCPKCSDICCAGMENLVSLRLRDVALLMDEGRSDLMARKKPMFPRWMLRQRPALHELISSDLWRRLPVLRQRGPDQVCAALSPELKCTLYPRWPTSCERFPYTLSMVRKAVVWGQRCPSKQVSAEFEPRRQEMYQAAIGAYNERVKDAVLLTHAKRELDELGIGAWIIEEGEEPFESADSGLPVIYE